MKKSILYPICFSLILLGFGLQKGFAQTYSLKNSESSMTVAGTSNLHDWECEVEDMSGKLAISQEGGVLTALNKLELQIVAESLSSGKNGMDKNTYKALNTKKYKAITYSLKSVGSLEQISANTYSIKTTGSLTISGVTKTVSIPFEVHVLADQIVLSGAYKMQMSTYKIDPPTALFGTITTGDELHITFKTTFINQSL
ncbi:YceI family protein [Leeuwenhoekiella marinoflava]|uniref:YceI-like domain-containing protein n=2 Tax=Leeuwenhoekiella marinoflava TaxID=988 RepID=A0A4Q0PI19_9FLAO|nr:YceI family protein [Leeuwenhoekiella marinoflava]RXG25909.1 YceI-like domain-containing protein [Leeuwenhoekiella marinoflava]SHF28646.1 YceI-like domain-containing protein [Leeuwenhoekiella marinoflava DSM 3653]